MLRAVGLTQYLRVTDGRTDGRTDGQTDGIAVASTVLAMRASRRAVKIENNSVPSHCEMVKPPFENVVENYDLLLLCEKSGRVPPK